MEVKGNHPLAEIIARKLFGIENIPRDQMGFSVCRTIVSAVAYHDNIVNNLKHEIERKEQALNAIYVETCAVKEPRIKFIRRSAERAIDKEADDILNHRSTLP